MLLKKLLCIGSVLSSLMLTSFEINLWRGSFEIHWIFIVIGVFLILLGVGIAIAKTKFVCPNCNKTFYTRWWKCIFTTHFDNGRALKCPHSHKTDICYPSYDQNKE